MISRVSAGFLLAAVPLAASAAPLRAPLAVEFALAVDSPGSAAAPTVRGRMILQPGGRSCARVSQPVRQEMRLGPEGAVLVWPASSTRLKIGALPGGVPPAFEALLVAVTDPAAALPKGSTLQSRERKGDTVHSRWRVALGVPDALGQTGTLGTLHTTEDAQGVTLIELETDKGVLQKRFALGARSGQGQRLPGSVVAEFYGKKGQFARRERWTLQQVAVQARDLGPCAEAVAGQVLRDL